MAIKRVIIVDDEPAARNNLKAVIEKFDELEIIAEVGDGDTAIKKIEKLKPDIVFLDIEMPEVDGFDVAWETEHVNYQLVFSTAYDKYALDAFNTKAIDYLLKPVRPELIEKCIKKILSQENIIFESLEEKKTTSENIVLSDGNSSRVLKKSHISFIEGIGRYRRLHLTKEGAHLQKTETIISDTTLEEFEEKLAEDNFSRVHRSFIVNTDQIINIRSEGRKHFVVLKECEEMVPVARSQYKELKARLSR